MTVEFLGETLLGRQWVFRKKKKFFAVVYFESLHPKSTVFTHVQKIALPLQKGSWEILIKSGGGVISKGRGGLCYFHDFSKQDK